MNELEKEVLRHIGEDVNSPDVFSDITQIRDSINDAIEEIAVLTGLYVETYSIPLYQGQAIYLVEFSRGQFGFPVDVFLRGQDRHLSQTDLIKLNMTNPGWMHDNGPPYEYFMIGMNYLCVHPAPSGTGGILDVRCAVIPDRYTMDNDRVKLREGFKKTVIHYAVSEYYATRGDARSAIEHMTIYLKDLGMDSNYFRTHEKPYVSQPTNNAH